MKPVSSPTLPGGSNDAPLAAELDRRAADLLLVRDILGGSARAWETFIGRYSGLIVALIRRYTHRSDVDEVRTLYVRILASLYERKLAGYAGRAALSTWIAAVARTEVMDELRQRFGRHDIPRGLRALDPEDRVIFTLYYVRGLDLRETLDHLRQRDRTWDLSTLLARLRVIANTLDDRVLRRIAYDLHAQSIGAASGRLLEYLDHARQEYLEHEGAHRPEYHLMEREARRTVDRVREIVAGLDARERRVLELRFERGWSAERIAEELGLTPRRRVYTLLERILRRLKRTIGRDANDGNT